MAVVRVAKHYDITLRKKAGEILVGMDEERCSEDCVVTEVNCPDTADTKLNCSLLVLGFPF